MRRPWEGLNNKQSGVAAAMARHAGPSGCLVGCLASAGGRCGQAVDAGCLKMPSTWADAEMVALVL